MLCQRRRATLTACFELSFLRNNQFTVTCQAVCLLQPSFCAQVETRLICICCGSEHQRHVTTSDLLCCVLLLPSQLQHCSLAYDNALTSAAQQNSNAESTEIQLLHEDGIAALNKQLQCQPQRASRRGADLHHGLIGVVFVHRASLASKGVYAQLLHHRTAHSATNTASKQSKEKTMESGGQYSEG